VLRHISEEDIRALPLIQKIFRRIAGRRGQAMEE